MHWWILSVDPVKLTKRLTALKSSWNFAFSIRSSSDALPVIWHCKGCANFKEASNESYHNTPTLVSSYGVFLDAVHLRVSFMTLLWHDSFELCTIKPFVPLLMCTGSYSLETLGSTRDLFINICSGIEEDETELRCKFCL